MLTDIKINEDAVRQQKKYLERDKRPRSRTSKKWLGRIKVIHNYLPQMIENQAKYSDISIDLNMGYFATELNDIAKELCTIVLPLG